MPFRYSFILDGVGSVHGRKERVSIHSLFFSFSKDLELEAIAEDEAWEIWDEVKLDWFTVDTGEEFEEVDVSETRGIGLYYLHVLLNDSLVKKIHLRRRQRKSVIFDIVSREIRDVLRWRLSR